MVPALGRSCSPDLLSLLSTHRTGFFLGRKVGKWSQSLGNSQRLSEHPFKGAEGERRKSGAENLKKKKREIRGTCKAGLQQGSPYFGKAGTETCRDELCLFRKVNSRLSLGFFCRITGTRDGKDLLTHFSISLQGRAGLLPGGDYF